MSNKLELVSVSTDTALKHRVYDVLHQAILAMDIYGSNTPPKLDERELSEDLGVSRTPVREALTRLEQEGLVQHIPRRGTFVIRKTKAEIIEIIEVCAALESMAARLATINANDDDLEEFHEQSQSLQSDATLGGAHIDEYSENNIRFHKKIIELSGNKFLIKSAKRSFVHMHAIRSTTIKHPDRTVQSIIDHERIINAIVNRETTLAERLVREHALKLAQHVKRHVHFLD